MKNFSLLLFVGLLLLSCNQTPTQHADTNTEEQSIVKTEPVRDGVFIHITENYNDPHRVLMPLKMAVLMADDKDVIVYMDIDATELLVKGAKDLEFAEFESLQAYAKQLIDKKVSIYACPTCLKVAGYESSDLIAGIQLAEKEKFFNFTKGRIINLDY